MPHYNRGRTYVEPRLPEPAEPDQEVYLAIARRVVALDGVEFLGAADGIVADAETLAENAAWRAAVDVVRAPLLAEAAEARHTLSALRATLLPHTPAYFEPRDVLAEAEAQAVDVRLYEEALGTVMPEGYDGDEAFPAIVRRWFDDLTSGDPGRQARARGEEASETDEDRNPPPARPQGAVSPGDPDWVDGFGPVPGSGLE